jgi:carbamoyltransferase
MKSYEFTPNTTASSRFDQPEADFTLGICMGEFSSAALVSEGRVLGASYEERFHRRKCISGFPYAAASHLLNRFGLSADRIRKVGVMNETVSGLEYALVQRLADFDVDDYLKEAKEYYKPRLYEGRNVMFLDVFRDRIDSTVFPADISDQLMREGESEGNSRHLRSELVKRFLGRENVEIKFIEHHFSHALYGAHFAPPTIQKPLIFTADSFGDYSNCNVYITSAGKIEPIYSSGQLNLGPLYRNLTLLLGMKPYQHEYKVMGMAPYASEKYARRVADRLAEYMTGFDGNWVFAAKPKDHYFQFRDLFEGERFDNIAGGLQLYFEEMLIQWFDHFMQRDLDFDGVVFSGGLSMNVKANLRLKELASKYRKPFFSAPSGDDYSHSISVALAADSGQPNWFPPAERRDTRLDLGYEFSSRDQENVVAWARQKGHAIEPFDPDVVARYLDHGKIFGLCAGNAEFGARALGNRSIIADPRSSDTIRRINIAIKQRDFWMPFAPAVLEGFQERYFKDCTPESHRHMALAARTTALGARELAAAVHPYDQTARPQIVKVDNTPYSRIISSFGSRTGVYGVLNTSLNLHGYPIVNDSSDLIFVFENSGLDGLITEKNVILKTSN